MATPVIMPRQGQSVEACLFTSWHVEKGASVKKGDLLFSYETDKAAFDAEAPEDGILLDTFASPGELIPVLQNIAVIGNEGESFQHLLPERETEIPDKKNTSSADIPEKSKITDLTGSQISPDQEIHISPRARKAAKKLKVSPKGIQGSGPEGRILEKDIINQASITPKATPLAKSISYNDQIPLPREGSGSGGKVVSADLKDPSRNQSGGEYEEKPLPNIRKIIARNMLASLQNTAQLTLHSSADARKILELRKKYKNRPVVSGNTYITINDLVCYAVVRTLKKHQNMNSHFLGESIRNYHVVHLGFAVDTPRGLMVPTIRNAHSLSLEQLAENLKSLASKAQKGDIDPELLTGATFSVTNLGALGVEMFTPVLNPPQVGILGINAIRFRAEDIGNGIIGFIPAIGLSLTFDHRAVDGAPAALFLKEVANQITNFETINFL